MVDYAPVLSKAVASLNPNTPEARRALYDRARRAMIDGLRSSDPSLSDTDLHAQTSALDDAIRKVEAQFAPAAPHEPDAPARRAQANPQADRAPPPPEPDYEQPADASAEVYPDQPALDQERKPFRLIAAGVAALAILGAGAAAYTFWPSRSTTPQAQRAATPPAQRAGTPVKRVDADAGGSAGYVYLRQPVYYRTNHPVGTIVVDKSQSFLYVVRPSVSAIRYGIGVGPDCTTAAGLYQIVSKEEWPGLKAAGGKPVADDERNKSPFGARALNLSKESRIHGTNAPATIGRTGSLGCFRLTNDDVIHLYDRAPLETRVVVLN
jgi:lipoprotein-anchoring transpeptidase ErfK/SrfK